MYSVYFPMLIIHWRYREIPRENLQCIIHINIYLQCMCIFCLKKIFRGTDAAVVAVGAKYISTTIYWNTLQHAATHCNTLQHTATHCNTLQHTATHCNTLQQNAFCRYTYAKGLSTTQCNTLQRTALHCNALQQQKKKDAGT